MENKGTNEGRKKITFTCKSDFEKRAAVEAIHLRQITKAEAAVLYGVTITTIRRWLVWAELGDPKPKPRIDWTLIQRVVLGLQGGFLTMEEALAEAGLSDRRTIEGWIRQYSDEIAPHSRKGKAKMKDSDTEGGLEAQELREQVQRLRLQVLALETMIEVAGEEYGEDLRKKFGSKQ